ncbi:hypothetical protein N9V84_03530 [Verrucomicrobiales bacterium]|nr:hypothetical protein [Verrucomicrobiales bacterium]
MIGLLLGSMLGAQEDEINRASALKLASMVPLNVAIRDFKLPQYDENRQPSATITAREIRRISDSRFILEGLRIILFTDGIESGDIVTLRAVYDIKHRLLVGRQRIKITTPDAISKGRGFIYDLESRKSAILSDVTSLIRFEKRANP